MSMIRLYKPIIILLIVLVLASFACSSGSSTQQPNEPANSQNQVESTEVGEEDKSTNTPGPSNTPKPTNTPEPTATATPAPIGLSRTNPYPISEVVLAPNWEIQVLEVKRGEEAAQAIMSANMFNDEAPEGMEYILVKIKAKSLYSDSDEHNIGSCDFDLTGDKFIRYSCGTTFAVPPEPALDATLFTGGETEGWVDFAVAQGEGNLILSLNETMNFDENAVRFIALDDSASLNIDPELANIKSNDLGLDKTNPAKLGELLITEDWEFTVKQVVRGNEAWTMAQEANQFNDPPAEGMEYVAVLVHYRSIGTNDRAAGVDGSFLSVTGSASVLYDNPYVIAPEPNLDAYVYPGGEGEGWKILQVAIDETDLILIIEPYFDFGSGNKRFVSLY